MEENEIYVRIQAAADLLGIHKNTLKNWEYTGKITVERSPINGHRMYKLSDLQGLLDARKK